MQYNSIASEGRATVYDQPLIAVQDVLRVVAVADAFVVLKSVDDIPKPKERMTRRQKGTLNALRAGSASPSFDLDALCERVVPPTVERTADGMVIVRFYSWHKWVGSVRYNSVILHADGWVWLSRSTLATSTGDLEIRTLM